jgi:hypothetical protein
MHAREEQALRRDGRVGREHDVIRVHDAVLRGDGMCCAGLDVEHTCALEDAAAIAVGDLREPEDVLARAWNCPCRSRRSAAIEARTGWPRPRSKTRATPAARLASSSASSSSASSAVSANT